MSVSSYSGTSPVSVVIADDHPVFLEGLCTVLNRNPYIEITGKATDGAKLLQVVAQKQPQVVITDIQMPEMTGIEATRQIKQ